MLLNKILKRSRWFWAYEWKIEDELKSNWWEEIASKENEEKKVFHLFDFTDNFREKKLLLLAAAVDASQ